MKLFDSHCHLDDRAYAKDRDAVIRRAEAAGVTRMMLVGITEASCREVVSIAENRNGLYAAVGVHPHDAEGCTEESLKEIRLLAGSPKVRAWGEIGLDFNRMYSPRKDQERWLIRQLGEADELNLTVVLHERDSGGRLLEILKDAAGERSGVVHCYSGTREEMFEYLDLGFHIGITGILTLKERGETLRDLVKLLPAERILIETDAPYLTPTPERNRVRRNEPAFVKSVLLKLAEVRGENPAELSEILWENTSRLFRIDPE